MVCEHPRRYDYAALVSAYGDGFDGMLIDKAFRDGETIQWEDYTIQVIGCWAKLSLAAVCGLILMGKG